MFKVGQKVVCIHNVIWADKYGEGVICDGPRKGEILEVDFIDHNGPGFFKYHLTEGYTASAFRPLDYDFVEEVIKQVKPETVEA